MKTQEIGLRLKELGWTPYRDGVNDWFAVRVIDDRIVTLGYAIRPYGDQSTLIMTPKVTTEAFDSAYQDLDSVDRPRQRTSGPKPGRGAPLVVRGWEGSNIQPSITVADVDAAGAEGVAWALRQDLAAALAEKLALPTTAPGNRPLCHLAALAITGDVGRLRHYADSFACGDRLGFVPYVSAAHIAQALALAEGYRRVMAGS